MSICKRPLLVDRFTADNVFNCTGLYDGIGVMNIRIVIRKQTIYIGIFGTTTTTPDFELTIYKHPTCMHAVKFNHKNNTIMCTASSRYTTLYGRVHEQTVIECKLTRAQYDNFRAGYESMPPYEFRR